LLKTWYIYYPAEVLNTIYNELGLAQFEAELLTPDDHRKIRSFIDGAKEENKKKPMMKPVPQQKPVMQPDMP